MSPTLILRLNNLENEVVDFVAIVTNFGKYEIFLYMRGHVL